MPRGPSGELHASLLSSDIDHGLTAAPSAGLNGFPRRESVEREMKKAWAGVPLQMATVWDEGT